MVTTIMIVTYIWNLFSIKLYQLHSLAKFWAFIANIKHMRVLQILDTLEIKANLNNILTWNYKYFAFAHRYDISTGPYHSLYNITVSSREMTKQCNTFVSFDKRLNSRDNAWTMISWSGDLARRILSHNEMNPVVIRCLCTPFVKNNGGFCQTQNQHDSSIQFAQYLIDWWNVC